MLANLDWQKGGGLIPAVVQDVHSGAVLMLGYMNQEALDKTMATGLLTFYSRTKQRLWTKGETSGHFLKVIDLAPDCDRDTLLVQAEPCGPVCHLGDPTCFKEDKGSSFRFLAELEQTIGQRQIAKPDGSYTAQLFAKGLDKIAQKVGEEAVEVVIASKNDDADAFLGECGDLVFHLTVLLHERGLSWSHVNTLLKSRMNKAAK